MLTPDEILGPSGRIAQRLAHYEHRGEQLAMAEAVAAAIRGKHHLMAEAGTGVGKSFAYLVPAILAVAQSDPDCADEPPRRIIVSTHTISLQEQLMHKDLPFLNSVIPLEFSAVLVKGRRQLSQPAPDEAGGQSGRQPVSSAEEDSTNCERWSIGRARRPTARWPTWTIGRCRSVWDEVASDSVNCQGRQCPTYEHCFYYQARRRVQHAQILVVNHALFFSDLALRRQGAEHSARL